MIEESEKSITESYNAGYKQGVLAYKPEAEFWRTKALGFEAELKKVKTRNWLFGLGGVAFGFFGGMSFGVTISF